MAFIITHKLFLRCVCDQHVFIPTLELVHWTSLRSQKFIKDNIQSLSGLQENIFNLASKLKKIIMCFGFL